MIIAEKIEVGEDILASGGFADVRSGTYMGQGRLFAVKTLRTAVTDDLQKIKKVSANNTIPDSLPVD